MCRVFEAGGGTGRPLKTSNHSVSFCFLKDSQTSLLRRRRGRIYGASPSAAGPTEAEVVSGSGAPLSHLATEPPTT